MALIAATRGIAGVGIGLLMANRIHKRHRRMVGGALLGLGALSTIPIAVELFRKRQGLREDPTIANVPQSGVDPSEGLRAD